MAQIDREMKTEERKFVVVETLDDLLAVPYETPSGEACPRLLFRTPEDCRPIPDCASPQVVAEQAFKCGWILSHMFVPPPFRPANTILPADPQHSLTNDAALKAIVPDLSYVSAVAMAMGRVKAVKLSQAFKRCPGPLVYLSVWDITVSHLPAHGMGYEAWKLSERGYVCTEEQAAWVTAMEREVQARCDQDRGSPVMG
jgi:hypothetical protein